MEEPVAPRPQTLWLKVVLVSCWIAQITFAISLFSAFVILGTPVHSWSDKRFITWIVLSIVPLTVLSLNLAEISLFALHELPARTYLIFQYIKSGLWIALSLGLCVWVTLIMILLVPMDDWDPVYWYMITMFVIATVCFVVPLIYAHNVYHYSNHGLAYETLADEPDENTPLLAEGSQAADEPVPQIRSDALAGGGITSSITHVHHHRGEP